MIFDPNLYTCHRLTDSAYIYRCIHAGKGKLYLVNSQTMKAHKYWFRRPVNVDEFPADTIFVYVFHDDSRWLYKSTYYLGKIGQTGLFQLTRGSRFEPDTEAVRGAQYLAKMSLSQDLVDAGKMHVYHDCKCCKCGRKLKGDWAVENGIGKKCLKKYEQFISTGSWDGNQ